MGDLHYLKFFNVLNFYSKIQFKLRKLAIIVRYETVMKLIEEHLMSGIYEGLIFFVHTQIIWDSCIVNVLP